MTEFKLYIDGQWVEGAGTIENLNPADLSDCLGLSHLASATQVNDAVMAAHTAFDVWSQSTPQQRFDVLDFTGTELLARKEDLGNLLAREEGKTLGEAIGEVGRAGQIFKFYAGECLRQDGEILDSVRPGVKIEITREPIGVIGIITPWNFPIAIPAWKLAPALAYGNTAVLKPSEITPGCAVALIEILSRAGLPSGTVNLITGEGAVAGQALVEHPDVAAISFTGSAQIGALVRETAVRRGARVQTEMGGKNPLIVLDDADLDIAVSCALNGAFFSTGQRCTASSRLIVTKGIADTFATRLGEAVTALTVGDPRGEGIQIGPVINVVQAEKVQRYVDLAIAEGGTETARSALPATSDRGCFIAPTLFDHTSADMTINCDEVFGPVASIIRVASVDEAINMANQTAFGLSAGICTNSLKYAEAFKRCAKAGMVMVNLPTAGVDYHVPFGGRKESSYGPREQGRHAREFYTIIKTAYQLA